MFAEPQMTDLPAEKQAAKAITHTLRNIAERPGVAWYLGHGTQTYALLTEAHATLHGITMAEAQENWPPAQQPFHDENDLNECPFCGGHAVIAKEDHLHMMKCLGCGARGPTTSDFLHDSELDGINCAARKWNERRMPH